ncbi:hypothetical protein GCM10009616_36130 [Microlunatus lacustris]
MNVAARVVRLSGIDSHPHNVRVDLGDLRQLTESIRAHGILTPVVLEVRGNRYQIRDGHRRVAAARLAKRNTVPAIVWPDPLSLPDWLTQAAVTACHRRGLEERDQARACAALRELGHSWENIALALNTTPAAVRRLVTKEIDQVGKPTAATRPWKPPTTVALSKVEAALEQGEDGIRRLLAELRTPPAEEVAS